MSSDITLFEMFGGVRPMARELSERPSTVQDWKDNERIPATKQPHVFFTARRLGLPVTTAHIVFPCGIPAGVEYEPDLFACDGVAPVPPCHGAVVSPAAPIVACDRSRISHPEAK